MAQKVKIIPLGNRVVVRPLGREEVTMSGIVLPDTASKERPQQGEIVAVGEGKRNEKGDLIALTVKVGQKVLFTKYGPDEIEIEGEEYLVLKEDDILAVLE
ncbi:MAG: co-chaperone GroES [Candidatus Abawacabacteria bacterium]|nr:co-chaperone GroES [Candidatus Abawacabacteria bacterium]